MTFARTWSGTSDVIDIVRTRGWTLLAIAIPAIAAIVTRLAGYDAYPLWLDEAWRANFILGPHWLADEFKGSSFATITSFVYGGMTHAVALIHTSSWTLRLTSLLPSLLAVLLFVPVVGRLTGSPVLGCLAGLAAALNLTFIEYAKEMKPYALELCLHLALVYIALRYANTQQTAAPSRRLRWLVLAAGPIAALTAANSVFILPGYYLMIAYGQFRRERRIGLETIASGAVSLTLLILQYALIWSRSGQSSLAAFWQDNFFADGDRFAWIGARLSEIVAASFKTATSPTIAGALSGVSERIVGMLSLGVSIALPLAALAGLIAAAVYWRRPEVALLVVLPIFGVVLANQAHIWPLGAIRPNLFLYGYFILLAFVGLGAIAELSRATRYAAAAILALWFGLVSLPNDLDYFARETVPPDQEAPRALAALYKRVLPNCQDRVLVMANSAGSHAVEYYTTYDSDFHETAAALKRCVRIQNISPEAYSDAPAFRETVRLALVDNDNIWFVWTHLDDAEAKMMKDNASAFGALDDEAVFTGAGIFHLTRGAGQPVEHAPETAKPGR